MSRYQLSLAAISQASFFAILALFNAPDAYFCPIRHVPAESARSAGEIGMALNCLHFSTMLTGGQLVVPFRVRLLGHVSFWPGRLVWSSAELTTGETSLAFGHAMEVRLSHRLQRGVPPSTQYKVFIVCDGWHIYSITR